MKKPNIFLDFDDVIFKTKATHLSYINYKYGLNIAYDDYVNYNNSLYTMIQNRKPNLNLTFNEIWLDIGKNFHVSMEWHEDIELIEGVQEIIPLLSKKYTLWIVTARQKSGLNVIYQLLDRYFKDCFKGVHCVYEWVDDELEFHATPKKDFILSISGEKIAFIDDSPQEIFKMENIIPTYLFDQDGRYNSFLKGVNKVKSWKDIGNAFL